MGALHVASLLLVFSSGTHVEGFQSPQMSGKDRKKSILEKNWCDMVEFNLSK